MILALSQYKICVWMIEYIFFKKLDSWGLKKDSDSVESEGWSPWIWSFEGSSPPVNPQGVWLTC